MGAVTTPVGLCLACRHARRITSGKGSTFWLCRRAEHDPQFAKYPRLPVLACAGFEDRPGAGDPHVDDPPVRATPAPPASPRKDP
jgi:hypothetical protein